jgi:hypothetical protein
VTDGDENDGAGAGSGAPRTGHPAVDAALTRLAGTAGHPPEEQIDAYESTHQALRETLSTIEEN